LYLDVVFGTQEKKGKLAMMNENTNFKNFSTI
jgi:hypothetical protein